MNNMRLCLSRIPDSTSSLSGDFLREERTKETSSTFLSLSSLSKKDIIVFSGLITSSMVSAALGFVIMKVIAIASVALIAPYVGGVISLILLTLAFSIVINGQFAKWDELQKKGEEEQQLIARESNYTNGIQKIINRCKRKVRVVLDGRRFTITLGRNLPSELLDIIFSQRNDFQGNGIVKQTLILFSHFLKMKKNKRLLRGPSEDRSNNDDLFGFVLVKKEKEINPLLTDYVNNCCSGVSIDDAQNWIKQGCEILRALKKEDENHFSFAQMSIEYQMCCVCWAFMDLAIQSGQGSFTEGTFCIADPGFKIFNYFEPYMYGRLSSHYPERLIYSDERRWAHFGLDISREGIFCLPAEKRHVLMGKIEAMDGSNRIYIKIEDWGCYPLNFISFIMHGLGYLRSEWEKLSGGLVPTETEKKEHIPPTIREAFMKICKWLFNNNSSIKFNSSPKSEFDSVTGLFKAYGIGYAEKFLRMILLILKKGNIDNSFGEKMENIDRSLSVEDRSFIEEMENIDRSFIDTFSFIGEIEKMNISLSVEDRSLIEEIKKFLERIKNEYGNKIAPRKGNEVIFGDSSILAI